MDENHVQNGTSVLEIGTESGVKKVGENAASRALNALIDGVKNKYGEAQVLLGTAFERYLHNATERYNQVRTLATGTTPRTIIGHGNIYVSVGVKYDEKEVSTSTIDSLLRIGKNILIIGTGGVGKSMLMRYLFLNTANRGEYVPVLLELRRISNQTLGKLSIFDLIYSCMEDFDVQLPKEQFEYSLRMGKYVFLLDGFDEVKESFAGEAAAVIQKFCSKYPKNPCIITSRPKKDDTSPLETFTVVESMGLSKEQAVQLASKIWEKDEKTKEFCKQLESELYEKHRDFAENPLLLSMMFLTFMRNNSVPNHLAEFYSKAYDALYSAHDSHDKGYYRREFQCNTLDEGDFRRLLSHFCFQSYFKEEYEFNREQILSYLKKSIKKLNLSEVQEADYLKDLQNVVCIIVEDGEIYRFSHRSFQAYFAACYTANILTDEQQKKLFDSFLDCPETFFGREDYLELLAQIEPKRFCVNALERGLREIHKRGKEERNPDVFLLRLQYHSIAFSDKGNPSRYHINTRSSGFNYVELFRRYVNTTAYCADNIADREYIEECMRLIDNEIETHGLFRFSVIDSVQCLADVEKELLYDSIARSSHMNGMYNAIEKWLKSMERERKKLTATNFIDDF